MTKIQLRRGTSLEWGIANPVLAAGEVGVDLTLGKMKIGDGTTVWSSLVFQGGGGGGSSAWGSITGNLSDQVDLQSALNNRQPLASVLTNTTAAYTASQETKLSGVAVGATANSSDSFLLDRANHTGVQVISTVTGLQSAIDSKQDNLVSGTNIKTVNGVSVLGSGDLVVGSSVVINEATLDFGTGSYNASVSVPDVSVTSSTRVVASLTGIQGRDADELEMSPIILGVAVVPSVGFEIYGSALQKADGQFIVHYTKA